MSIKINRVETLNTATATQPDQPPSIRKSVLKKAQYCVDYYFFALKCPSNFARTWLPSLRTPINIDRKQERKAEKEKKKNNAGERRE